MSDIELKLHTSAGLNGESKESNDRGYQSLNSPPIESQIANNIDDFDDDKNKNSKVSNSKLDDQTEFEELMTKLVTRNYEIILFFVCFSIGIGFIMYLFSGRDYWIWALTIAGLILGLIVDQIWFNSENITKYQIEKEKGAAHNLQWEPYKYAKVLCKSELVHPRTHHVRTKNWVLTDNQTLIFHKEALARIEGYHGWEIGASISSFLGFLGSLINALATLVGANPNAGEILANIGIIILFTIVLGIIGALIEKQLRHLSLLYPTHISVEHEVAVPLYEIGHFEYYRLGYYSVYHNNISVMLVERLALLWFKVLVWTMKFIYKIIQGLLYACYVNSFFVLYLLITGTLAFLYAAHIGKDQVWLGGAIIGIWICFVACAIMTWFFSTHCRGRNSFSIATYNVSKIGETRMPASTVRWFFINLVVILTLLLIVASLVSFVFDSFYKIKLPVIQLGNKNQWFRDLTCKNPSSGTSGNTNGAFISKDADFCKDNIYNGIAASLGILTFLWFWTLISSLVFYLKDKRSKEIIIKDENKDKKVWIQYINFSIYRSPYIQYHSGHYTTQYSFINFFLTPFYLLLKLNGFNNHMFPVNIQLTPEDAHILSQYLVQNVHLYNGKYNSPIANANANGNGNGNVINSNLNASPHQSQQQRQFY